MGICFQPYSKEACCLCGSTTNLTGEHKIKASSLRAEFGGEHMVISSFGGGDGLRSAQGPKSKEFHFAALICVECNSTRTQPADREFVRFDKGARELLGNGEDPSLMFGQERYTPGAPAYLNLFRYFAKLLCCHMAELGAPRSERLSRFAVGQSDAICVWLAVDRDVTFSELSVHGVTQYAAHGGLVVYGDKTTGDAKAFHSTLAIGPLRYVFLSRLTSLEQLELRFAYREFTSWCREQVEIAKDSPIPLDDQRRLGLIE